MAQINASAKASYAEADQILGASAQWRITDRLNGEVAVEDYIHLRRAGSHKFIPSLRSDYPAQRALISLIDRFTRTAVEYGRWREYGENPFSGAGWSGLTQPPFETWVPTETASDWVSSKVSKYDCATENCFRLR